MQEMITFILDVLLVIIMQLEEVMSHLVKEHYPLVVVVISLHLVNLLVNIHLFSILFILVYTLEHVDVLMQRLELDVTHFKVVLQ